MSVWTHVDRLVDGTSDLAGLRAHGIQLLAARRWRATGRALPLELRAEERYAAIATLAAPVLLARVRAIIDTPIVLLKGPVVAARYPDPVLRPFGDLDLLVADAEAAQHALLMAGFQLEGDARRYVGHHHRQPLSWPGLPLVIEIHDSPGWLGWMTPPDNDELFTTAVPSPLSVDGMLALPPSYQAAHLAAHSWQHGPLPRLRDLIDVMVMTEGLDPVDLARLVRRWRMERVWAATIGAIEILLRGRATHSWPLRLWARHLGGLRERRAIEARIARWVVGGLWAPTPTEALRAVISTVGAEVRPWPEEPWTEKLARIGDSLRMPFVPESEQRARH